MTTPLTLEELARSAIEGDREALDLVARQLQGEQFAENLAAGLEPVSADDTEQSLLIDDVKVECSLAMLQCLDRSHRLAYVLGEIMELSGPEAAGVLEITPALFRKRLQHARDAVLTFTKSHCGLVSDAAPCRCSRRVSRDAIAGVTGVHPPHFGRRATSFTEARALVRRVEEARWAMEVHRSSQPQAPSIDFAQRTPEQRERFDVRFAVTIELRYGREGHGGMGYSSREHGRDARSCPAALTVLRE